MRISLTQRCNFDCIYCHHEGEGGFSGELSFEEVERILSMAKKLGINKLKLTGGEPLLRRDLPEIVQMSKKYVNEVSVTTNGTLMKRSAGMLRDAGLDRANISLDSLRGDRFRAITSGDLRKAVDGLNAAISEGINPIKLNMVILKGINEDEVFDMVKFSFEHSCILQLIELETTRNGEKGEFYRKYHYDFDGLEKLLEDKAERVVTRAMHHRKKYFFDGAEVEVVRPMHNTEFCRNCTRVRVTSSGEIKPCLLDDKTFRLPKDDEAYAVFKRAIESKKPYWG